MANNRIYLRCNVCGEAIFLGKSFGDGFYWVNYKEDGEHLEDKLNAFYDKHKYCDQKKIDNAEYDIEAFPIKGKSTNAAEGDFSIAYEETERDEALESIGKLLEQAKEKPCSGVLDKNKRAILKGDIVRGLFLYGNSIDGICDFKNGAFGVKWMRGEIEEFTPFCCTHGVEWEVIDE